METKVCETCGKEFYKNVGKKAWEKRRFCSLQCFGRESSTQQRRPDRPCQTCGEPFHPPRRDSKYCSIKCATARFEGRKGDKHQAWKGGRHTDSSGYVHIYVPDDHRFASMRRNSHYALEHRIIMAERLGRPLASHETVHHKNGKRDDNRPENLQLRQGRHGKGVHHRCRECGSTNIEALPLD